MKADSSGMKCTAALPFREDRQAISPTATVWMSAGSFSPTTPAGPGLSAAPSLTNQHAVFPSHTHINRQIMPTDGFTSWYAKHKKRVFVWSFWRSRVCEWTFSAFVECEDASGETEGEVSGLLNNAVRFWAADGADQEKPAVWQQQSLSLDLS